jgi:hypothetical protein
MKTTLLSLLLLLFCNSIIVSQSHSNQLKKPTKQYKSIHLELIDNRYDSLSVIAINYKAKNNEYKGKSKDGRNWYFKIPESVFNKTKGLAFRNFPTYDKEAIKMLNLYFIERSDTFMSPNYINFNKTKNINIKLKYVKRDSIQSYHKNLAGEIKLTKYIDDFYVMKEPDIENILSVRENANFCWFNINRNPNKTYKEFLTGYVELIKQYPNSKTLLTMLLDEFEGGKFRSKEDIQLLFNSFSKQNKNSYFGHILKEKLSVATTSSKFQNFRLPNSVSHKLEPIITDSAKYNLIIFSA